MEGETEDVKKGAIGTEEVYAPFARNQVLFDLWLTQILTEEKRFDPELLSAFAFEKFLLKMNPRADIGPKNRYLQDNLKLMYKRMRADIKSILEKDMAVADTVVYVPQFWFNPVTLNTFVVSRLNYIDKSFSRKTIFLDMQKVKNSYPETVARVMDKHFKMVPGIRLNISGKFVYSPISGTLNNAVEKMKTTRLNFVGIPALLKVYWAETLNKFTDVRDTFQKADNILGKMQNRPFYANWLFLKAKEQNLKVPAWKPARNEQMRVLFKLCPILTQTTQPEQLPAADFFTEEEVDLFKRLFEVEKEFQDLLDYLKKEPTVANGEFINNLLSFKNNLPKLVQHLCNVCKIFILRFTICQNTNIFAIFANFYTRI